MENRRIARFLSLIYPGVGNLYNGQIRKWSYYTCLQFLLTMLFPATFRLVGSFASTLLVVGTFTVVLLPFALVPICWLVFVFIFLPRYSAYKDATNVVVNENQESNMHTYFNKKQQLTIVVLVMIIEVIVSLFLFEYFWIFTEHMIW